MCNIHEAKRHEKLAELFAIEGNTTKAMEHYLEAVGIYVLNIELLKQEELVEEANRCYNAVEQLRGEKGKRRYSKQELARVVVEETHSHHHEELTEIEELLGSKV